MRHTPKRPRPARGAAKGAERGFILTVVDGLNPGKEYFFEKTAAIGRVEENDIVLVEPGISRTHARILDDHGVFVIEDAGSANGTRLNGEVLSGQEVLRDGDYVTLSQTTLQFSLLNAPRGEITIKTSAAELEARAADDVKRATRTPMSVRAALGSRRGKLVAGVLGALLLAALAGGVAHRTVLKGKQSIVFDQSDTPLTYSDTDGFFNAVLGYGKFDRSHRDQLIVEFEYLDGRVTLHYAAWGIDKVGEVAIVLNDRKVGQVPLTWTLWEYDLKMQLPRNLLRKGTNRLVFDNIRNPPNEDLWEVCYIKIVQEALPPPDAVEARHQFELAKKAWEDRDLDPGNMYTALVGFRKARDLLEGMAEQSELHQEARDYIDRVDQALTKKFKDGLFSAQRAERLGSYEEARTFLLQTRRYFRKEDTRHREIVRRLDALAGE